MDKIASVKKRMRHQKWLEMYEAYLSSGQTVVQWCAENGLSKKTFYYRQRKIRGEAIERIEQHEIVPIEAATVPPVITSGTIRISGSGIDIEMPTDISPEVVTAAIRGLRLC